MSIAGALFTYYTGRGVPASSAAALAGVQDYENGGGDVPNPGGDAAGVFGISQWTGSRSTLAQQNGIGPGSSLEDQANYTLTEMQSRNPSLYGQLMDGTATPSQIVTSYETPSGVVRGAIQPNTPASRETAAATTTQSSLLGGAGTPGTNGEYVGVNQGDDTASYLSAANQGVGADTPNLQDSDFDGLSDSDIVGTGTTLPNDPASSIQSVNAGTLAQSLGGSAPQAANPAAAAAGGGGTPIDITDFSGPDTAISGAGTAVQKGATTAGSDVETAAGGIAGTAASIFNSFESYASGAVIILALVVLGLIFVAFGLGMFKHNLIPAAA